MDRWTYRLLIAALLAAIPLTFVRSPVMVRAGAIVVVCLYIWLAEVAPPFVPTLLLWASVPLLLAPLDPKFSAGSVLAWAADPVMVLFFGGFALGVGTSAYGIDRWLAHFALRRAGNSLSLFLLFVLLITGFLSMWLSNIAAAALILACLRPILQDFGKDHLIRRVVLVAVALGANLGGIATPIGTGPNAIAIASIDQKYHVSFFDWMVFALPLTIVMLGLSYVMLLFRVRGDQEIWAKKHQSITVEPDGERITGQWKFLTIISLTVLLWLSEPVHGVPSSVIAISSAGVLFLTGMLTKRDLLKIDWSTLLLIAGGITLGRLLEQSGLVAALSAGIPFSQLNTTMALFVICLVERFTLGAHEQYGDRCNAHPDRDGDHTGSIHRYSGCCCCVVWYAFCDKHTAKRNGLRRRRTEIYGSVCTGNHIDDRRVFCGQSDRPLCAKPSRNTLNHYLPIQKVENIRVNMSSVVVSPVISPR